MLGARYESIQSKLIVQPIPKPHFRIVAAAAVAVVLLASTALGREFDHYLKMTIPKDK